MNPDGWTTCSLGNLVLEHRNALVGGPFGSNLVRKDYVPVGVPVIRGQNMGSRWVSGDYAFVSREKADALAANTARPGDLVFTQRGTLGQVAIVPQQPFERYIVSQSQMKASVDAAKAQPLFLYYFFFSERQQKYIHANAIQTGVPHTNLGILREHPILLPPICEQQAIAGIFGALDDKIELNRRMDRTLEAIARAIFKSWFVDFDPVKAKAEGRKPTGLDAETAALFPNSFDDSPLGPIPEGWKVMPLPAAFDVNPTLPLGKGTVAPYLDMKNMPTTSARAERWIDRAFTAGTKFINGDVLVARITPCLENGKTAFVDFLDDGQVGWGSTEFIVLRSRPPFPVEYAYFLARSEGFREHAIVNMTGSSGRQRVPVSCFDAFDVVVPSDPLAGAFGRAVKPIMAAVKSHDEESRTLAAIRDALLPKLLSGEIRVKDVERIAEEVA